MNMRVILKESDIKDAILEYVEKRGMKTQGASVSLESHPGSSDPREPFASSVGATVELKQ